MERNKMYKVERILAGTKEFEIIFIGRMRDAKKCIKALKEEYEIRGFDTLNTEFNLLIYEKGRVLAKWIYSIDKK